MLNISPSNLSVAIYQTRLAVAILINTRNIWFNGELIVTKTKTLPLSVRVYNVNEYRDVHVVLAILSYFLSNILFNYKIL